MGSACGIHSHNGYENKGNKLLCSSLGANIKERGNILELKSCFQVLQMTLMSHYTSVNGHVNSEKHRQVHTEGECVQIEIRLICIGLLDTVQ